MSGLAEIKQWVKENLTRTISFIDNVDEAYDFVNNNFIKEGSSELDDILVDDKPAFLDFLETQISQPFEPPVPEDFIFIRSYSYIRNGKVINVTAHLRRKRK